LDLLLANWNSLDYGIWPLSEALIKAPFNKPILTKIAILAV
jgi:hypothetical protein